MTQLLCVVEYVVLRSAPKTMVPNSSAPGGHCLGLNKSFQPCCDGLILTHINIYMLFTGWEVRTGKIFRRGLKLI